MNEQGYKSRHEKQIEYAKLIAEGVPSARAARMVGIHPRTARRYGRTLSKSMRT